MHDTHLDFAVRLETEPLGDRPGKVVRRAAGCRGLTMLTGSGGRPSRGCASCGKSFGKAKGAREGASDTPAGLAYEDVAVMGSVDAPSCLDVVRGGGGGWWRGEEK